MSHVWDFVIKRNDTGPDLEVQCLDEDGDPVDISGYGSITFKMRNMKTGITKVDSPASPVSITNGRIKYVWQAADTNIGAEYEGEFKVVMGTGQTITFPNNTFIKIKVYESVTALA